MTRDKPRKDERPFVLTPDVVRQLNEILGPDVVQCVRSSLQFSCRYYGRREPGWNARPEPEEIRAFTDASRSFLAAWADLPALSRSYLPRISGNPKLLESLAEVTESLERVVHLQMLWRRPLRGRRPKHARRAFLYHVARVLSEANVKVMKTRGGVFERVARVLFTALGRHTPQADNIDDLFDDLKYAVDEQRLHASLPPVGALAMRSR
jgi:hypothetical protein